MHVSPLPHACTACILCEHVKITTWNGWSQIYENCNLLWRQTLPLLSSAPIPWRRWRRRWCGRRSCPRMMPSRCPSSPHPPLRTARPCPPSGGDGKSSSSSAASFTFTTASRRRSMACGNAGRMNWKHSWEGGWRWPRYSMGDMAIWTILYCTVTDVTDSNQADIILTTRPSWVSVFTEILFSTLPIFSTTVAAVTKTQNLQLLMQLSHLKPHNPSQVHNALFTKHLKACCMREELCVCAISS